MLFAMGATSWPSSLPARPSNAIRLKPTAEWLHKYLVYDELSGLKCFPNPGIESYICIYMYVYPPLTPLLGPWLCAMFRVV